MSRPQVTAPSRHFRGVHVRYPCGVVHRTHEQNHIAVVVTDGKEEGAIHDHLENAGLGGVQG
jgi:hypothetical protein